MSQTPPEDTIIGTFQGQNVYVEDILKAYSSTGESIEKQYNTNLDETVFDNSTVHFRVPKRVEEPKHFTGAIGITEMVNWTEFVHLPINKGIKMMFEYFQKNLQDIFEERGEKIVDGFGGVMCIVYPKYYKEVHKTFWAHHTTRIFKNDPKGDISIYE
jgi:hypothetical protein